MTSVAPLNRTLEQELTRCCAASNLECLVCGEFVLHCAEADRLPGVRAGSRRGGAAAAKFDSQAG